MKIIDITGPIYTGMWVYEEVYPPIEIVSVTSSRPGKKVTYQELFNGMGAQTGTYLETPAHFFKDAIKLNDVPIEKLFMVPAVVINLKNKAGPPRQPITAEELGAADVEIREGDGILVGTGWGKKGREPDYLTGGPYFTYDAMKYLISKKPFLLGADMPRWDNLESPQGFWPEFYEAGILMLAPVVNLEKIAKPRVQLVVMPIKVENTCAAPCRALIIEA